MVNAAPLSEADAELYENMPHVMPDELHELMTGEAPNLSGKDNLPENRDAIQQQVRNVKKITEYVTLYHPDRRYPSTIYIVPMNAHDRRTRLMQLLGETKMVQGKMIRWNFPRPQVEPLDQKIRCFVIGCMRAGGFVSRLDLVGHIRSRHPDEMPMYQALIDRIMKSIISEIDETQLKALGLDLEEDEIVSMEGVMKGLERGGPALHYCKWEGCTRFFDREDALEAHVRSHQRTATANAPVATSTAIEMSPLPGPKAEEPLLGGQGFMMKDEQLVERNVDMEEESE
jgi:hypothetical protein